MADGMIQQVPFGATDNPYAQGIQGLRAEQQNVRGFVPEVWDLLSGRAFQRQNEMEALNQRARDLADKQSLYQSQVMDAGMKQADYGLTQLARKMKVDKAQQAYSRLTSDLATGNPGSEQDWMESGAVYRGGTRMAPEMGMPIISEPRQTFTFNDLYGGELTAKNFPAQSDIYQRIAKMPVTKYDEINKQIIAQIQKATQNNLDYKKAIDVARDRNSHLSDRNTGYVLRMLTTMLDTKRAIYDPEKRAMAELSGLNMEDLQNEWDRVKSVAIAMINGGKTAIPPGTYTSEDLDKMDESKMQSVVESVISGAVISAKTGKIQQAKQTPGTVGSGADKKKPPAMSSPQAKPAPGVPKSSSGVAPPVKGEAGKKYVVKKQYSKSRNQTRFIYNDGTIEVVNGRK